MCEFMTDFTFSTVCYFLGGFIADIDPVSLEDREVICRLRNCVKALSFHNVQLYDTSLMYAYDASQGYHVSFYLFTFTTNSKILPIRQVYNVFTGQRSFKSRNQS